MEMALLYDGVKMFAETSMNTDIFPGPLDCETSVWTEGSTYRNYLEMVSSDPIFLHLIILE